MPLAQLGMYLLVAHMGTLMSLQELASQWKSVLIAVAGVIGVCIMTLTIGNFLFDFKTVITATPPLTGGVVAAMIMSEGASAQGLDNLAVLAIVMYVMQGFVGYPLTALCLKREGKRLLNLYQEKDSEEVVINNSGSEKQNSQFRIFSPLPDKYKTTFVILAKLGLVAWAAVAFAGLINGIISKYVVCLIFGLIAAEIGFLERKPLNKSGSFGFLITSLMAYIFAQLAKASPEMLGQIAISLAGIIVLGVLGMGLISILVGQKLGYSKAMSFAVALTALYGFPPNYILTDEATTALAETEKEKEYLMNQMLPKMLVGGFTTVTIVSVVIAGFFIKLL